MLKPRAEKSFPAVFPDPMFPAITLRLDPARNQLISGFIDSYLRLNSSEKVVFPEELGEALLDFETESDLLNWLAENCS